MPASAPAAVFLSYASQDAEAVARIAEALRAAGVEVWFDKDELVGGDAWDAKIRGQIASCALFVPVISAATQARREGYFRIEWRLAAQRTHAMSDDTPFLLPVVIDETRDADAKVPAEFKAVQWTRLPGAEPGAAFSARVVTLLGGQEARGGGRAAPVPGNETLRRSASTIRRVPWFVMVTTALAMLIALAIWQPWKTPVPRAALAATESDRALLVAPASTARSQSIAVLAFANLSDDKNASYFSDGISEALSDVLGKVPGLKVISAASARHFKGDREGTPGEMGRQLGVAHLVSGSVQPEGTKVRVIARLIRVDTGEVLWTQKFDGELKNVLVLQEEIAGLIARNLQLKLGVAAAASSRPVDPEVYQLYLRGRQAFSLRTPEGFRQAEQLYNEALKAAPDFVRARAARADVRMIRDDNAEIIGSYGKRNSTELAALVAEIEHAVASEPNLGEAHASLGYVRRLAWRPEEAMRASQLAVSLSPNYSTGHHWLGLALIHDGRMDEGLAAFQRAVELDPFSSRVAVNYAMTLQLAGRPSQALIFAERALALQPESAQAMAWKARALSDLGRSPEAAAVMRRALPLAVEGQTSYYAPGIFATAGLNEESDRALAAVKARGSDYNTAIALLTLGKTEEALALLNAEKMRSNSIPTLLYGSMFDPVRTDSRFIALLTRLHLTAAHARAQVWRAAHPPEKPLTKK